MFEGGATHLGVATDHVIESFRNELWPGYKTGDGIEPALFAQFHPLEEALVAMGVVVWPMIELEADDALASAARLASAIPACREGVHLDRRTRTWRSACATIASCRSTARATRCATRGRSRKSSASPPALIPDFLALVGDAADGYPGIAGIGAVTAARLLNRHGPIEAFPADVLGDPAQAGTPFQAARNAPDRRSPVPQRRRTALARANRPLCLVGTAYGGAALAGARAKGDARLRRRVIRSIPRSGAGCAGRCNSL